MTATEEQRSLVSVNVRFDFSVARDYFARRDGLLRDAWRCALTLLLLVGGCAVQNTLPTAFPEIPAWPAVWLCTWFAIRCSATRGFLFAIACGLLLDAGAYHSHGQELLLLFLATAAARLTSQNTFAKHPLLRDLLSFATSMLTYLACRILLLGGDMPRNVRLDFFQNTLPYGLLFGVLAGWPPLAAILDRAYALFPPNPK